MFNLALKQQQSSEPTVEMLSEDLVPFMKK